MCTVGKKQHAINNPYMMMIIDTPSLKSFKARINKHWRQYKYSLRSVHEAYNPTKKLLERS